ncbi:hydroxymethylglutaryl-CoA lyase [Schauerella aestuarii]|uniref:hydroxymethylglutaryl-CoA lyase n=1 Tax=Schauerella aestuarii TaxID=2511204 RepID=UPI00136F1089|nr:hydroxymethylglutaryl-CoA lyase [Achromobacter aestuarii]MYZ42018.1 hydroxymethylglutaryl-CoA lyase [Achromobacter aestuarii]
MERLFITDVAPRDGLQNQPVLVGLDTKLTLIDRLVAAGVESIEATSFVSPKAVPQMADAGELIPRVRTQHPGLRASALVPNMKGLERAHAAGAEEIAVVLSATEIMNLKNINMGLAQATDVSEQTVREAIRLGLRTRAYVAVAFDCPFEGPTSLDAVHTCVARMAEAGAQEIVIADTIGSASPGAVSERLTALLRDLPADRLAVHFHDTRGMAVANAWAALQAGIRRFDASVGGIGGCPFAPGAAGNLATEDLVLMAEASGYTTGISLDSLLDIIDFAETALQRPLGGRSVAWQRKQRSKIAS